MKCYLAQKCEYERWRRTSQEVRELKLKQDLWYNKLYGRTSQEVRELKCDGGRSSFHQQRRTSQEVRELKLPIIQ